MKARLAAVAALAFFLGFACGQGTPVGTADAAPPEPAVAAVREPDLSGLSTEERRDIEVFRRSSPSVVFITSSVLQREFFSMNVQEIPQGSGSGFVWDRDGHIVTNFHVVENAQRLSVRLADGSDWEAKFVGATPDKDCAVLKIDAPADRLKPVTLGKSESLLVGQKVFAVGNPFGFDHSLTVGVVSALGRELTSPNNRTIRDVIQTDAAINPGNSGGPLLDSGARVIGVNTAIYTPSGGSAGIGFAVPIDVVARIVPQLIRTGKVERPVIGFNPVPDRVARDRGIDDGVAIYEVVEGSPADRAGLVGIERLDRRRFRWGDVIVAVDGKRVESLDDLLWAFEEAGVGKTVTLTVRRGDDTRKVPIRLEASR